MRYLSTQSQLARIVGVDQSTVFRRAQSDLADAMVGKKIDVGHPSVQAFIREHDKDPTDVLDAYRQSANFDSELRLTQHESEVLKDVEVPANIEDIGNMTVREVMEKFGTRSAFLDWLVAVQKIEQIRERQLNNAETEGSLINRDLVKQHIFGAIESANRRLLTDTPKTLARRVYAMCRSGTSIEEAEKTVAEIIGSQLKPVKATAARLLRQN